MPDEASPPRGVEEKIEVAVGPDFKETKPLTPSLEEAPQEIQDLTVEGDAEAPLELPEKWWEGIESEDDLKAHDRAKPWLEETQDKARREIHSRLHPLINQRNTYLGEMTKTGQRFVKEIEKASREGMIGDDLLDRYEDVAGKMSGAYWHLGRFDGGKAMLQDFANVLDDQTLVEDFKPRIEMLEQGGADDKLFPDLVKRLANTAAGKESASSEKKGYDKGVADGRKAAMEEMRARQRENNGPDLNRKTTAGGTALSPERYKNMTADERMKLTPAQIDQMTAELARNSR